MLVCEAVAEYLGCYVAKSLTDSRTIDDLISSDKIASSSAWLTLKICTTPYGEDFDLKDAMKTACGTTSLALDPFDEL